MVKSRLKFVGLVVLGFLFLLICILYWITVGGWSWLFFPRLFTKITLLWDKLGFWFDKTFSKLEDEI